MFVQTATKAQVTLRSSVDTGYISYFSAVMFKTRGRRVQRRAQEGRFARG